MRAALCVWVGALLHLAAAMDVSSTCSASKSCHSAISAALTACGKTPGCWRVQLQPPGATFLLSGAVSVGAAASNVALDGQGAVLNATVLSPFVLVSAAKNITFARLTLDMYRPPYTYGRVVARNATSFTMAVDVGAYPPPSAAHGGRDAFLSRVQAVLQYDADRQRPAVDAYDSYADTTCAWDAGRGTLTVFEAPPASLVGSWVIVRHQVYSMNGFSMTGVVGATLEDVTLFNAGGMGTYFELSRDVVLSRVRVLKPPGRPMSITADGTHFNTCGGSIVVRDSTFEGQGDDGANVHGKFAQVAAVQGTTVTYASSSPSKHSAFLGNVGEAFQFLTQDTMQPVAVATLRVANTSSRTLQFDTALPAAVAVGGVFRSMAWAPSATFVNTSYVNNRARGILAKTGPTVITDCVFRGNSGP